MVELVADNVVSWAAASFSSFFLPFPSIFEK